MREDRPITRSRIPSPGAHIPGLWLLITVTTALIASVDYLTGPDVYITDFYLIPILALGWLGSLRSSVLLTLAILLYRVLLYSLVWQAWAPGLLVAYWNLASEAGFIAVIVTLMAWLKGSLHEAHRLALTDDLTETANRRAFYLQTARAMDQALPLSLAYLDADDFKQVNDRLGHQVGDRLLILIGHTLQHAVRPTDLVARLGGDEFAILLPETDAATALQMAIRCRDHLLAAMQDEEVPVTFSAGVLTCEQPPASVDVLVSRADALMYAAKSQGKNAVVQGTIAADSLAA